MRVLWVLTNTTGMDTLLHSRSGETSGISSDSMSITVTAQSTITITCPATQSAFPQTATDLLGSSAVTGGSSSTVVLVTGLSDNSSSTDGLSNFISTTGSLTMSTTTGLTFTQSGGSYDASTDSYIWYVSCSYLWH